VRVDAGIIAVISSVPTTVGFVFLMLDADISSETLVPLSLREKLSMFMFADLIESEVRLLGISPSGIEALIPEALGISRSTVETIRDEMYC
jgi:hypothetical protein